MFIYCFLLAFLVTLLYPVQVMCEWYCFGTDSTNISQTFPLKIHSEILVICSHELGKNCFVLPVFAHLSAALFEDKFSVFSCCLVR